MSFVRLGWWKAVFGTRNSAHVAKQKMKYKHGEIHYLLFPCADNFSVDLLRDFLVNFSSVALQ